MNCVSEIVRDDGIIVTDTVSKIENYNLYNKLYDYVHIDNDSLEDFTSVITPAENDIDRDSSDKDISISDIHAKYTGCHRHHDMVEDNANEDYIINVDQMKANISLRFQENSAAVPFHKLD